MPEPNRHPALVCHEPINHGKFFISPATTNPAQGVTSRKKLAAFVRNDCV
jgi:hypothetical protein